jgi:group I intron endonuclease
LITNKIYIGSSISLGNRFSTYYSLAYLKNKVIKGSSIIYNSLLKYGHSNFSIDILEYCEPSLLVEREQYYIDILKPEYNILKNVGSRLGSKQSEETKQLISNALKNRIFSDKFKEKMKISVKLQLETKSSFFGRTHTIKTRNIISLTKFLPVKIMNIETNTEKYFLNNVEAAKYLEINVSTLRKYKKEGKILYRKYIITNV